MLAQYNIYSCLFPLQYLLPILQKYKKIYSVLTNETQFKLFYSLNKFNYLLIFTSLHQNFILFSIKSTKYLINKFLIGNTVSNRHNKRHIAYNFLLQILSFVLNNKKSSLSQIPLHKNCSIDIFNAKERQQISYFFIFLKKTTKRLIFFFKSLIIIICYHLSVISYY